jgi:hypothetical protein
MAILAIPFFRPYRPARRFLRDNPKSDNALRHLSLWRRLAMMSHRLPLALFLLMSVAAAGAQQLPFGATLPVMSSTTLSSAKAKQGDRISATLMQDVVLASGERIRKGAKLQGQVVEVAAASPSAPARITVRFDTLVDGSRQYSLTASLRALASMQDVFNAQLPTSTFDEYGTSISDWTTVQVGGAAVYLGDQTVRDGMQIIGEAPGYGITRAKLIPAPKLGCPGTSGESGDEVSLWVFSPWACGAYGFGDLTISHHGVTAPVGQIVLSSPRAVYIRAGSGWLLRVVQTPVESTPQPGQ